MSPQCGGALSRPRRAEPRGCLRRPRRLSQPRLLPPLPAGVVRHFAGGELPSDAWFGQQAVYRISLGNFVLFAALAAAMAGVRNKSDRRDTYLHHGHWALKAGLWALCNALPFFLPNGVVNAYSWLARFGSPFFLLIQMVILLVSAG